jgi:hypothetical protein
MNLNDIENYKIIKLMEFSLKDQSFSVQQACNVSGVSPDEFSGLKYSLYVLKGAHENIESNNEILDWRLTPEAYFNYLSFIQYKHSVLTSKRAQIVAICSLLISSLIGVASLVSSLT